MTRKLSPAQNAYMLARANYETIAEIEKDCKNRVLAENIFVIADEWEEDFGQRITDHRTDYLMSDEEFTRYVNLCFVAYKKEGIALKTCELTPSGPAWETLKQAEKNLLAWSKQQTLGNNGIARKFGLSSHKIADIEKVFAAAKHNIDLRHQLVDLALKLAV